MKKLWRRFVCFMNRGHNYVSKERFYSSDGMSGINQYKIVCEKCGKGEDDEWEENSLIFIVK